MKTHIKAFGRAILLIAFLSAAVSFVYKPKSEVVTIQTSAICESCKKRIESTLKTTEGVEEANLNLNNKKVKVKYDPSKTSADKIRMVISNLGYDADEVKKSTEGFNKLPHCCQTKE